MLDGRETAETSTIKSRLVTFKGPSGMQVVAYVDEGPEEQWNERFVVLAPRYGETKKNNLQLAYTLVCNGFKVLRFDHTNHPGESDGTIYRFSLPGAVEDILAAVNYVDQFFEPGEIILITLSLSCRSGLRACVREPRIARFVSIVGMVDLSKTLSVIYNRDFFKSYAEEQWKSIDVLGFEVEAANFYGSLYGANMQDLSGTLEDAAQVGIPLLNFYAEKDCWVRLEDVQQVMDACQQACLKTIPNTGHEINENNASVKFVFEETIRFCGEGLKRTKKRIELPDKRVLIAQNKVERSRLQRVVQFEQDEERFWGDYLGRFGIIEEAQFYVQYFQKVADLLGTIRQNETILDAGCGNGFYGLNVLRSLMLCNEMMSGMCGHVHYHAMDLTPDGLLRSYSRHADELVALHREQIIKAAGIGFSYSKVDFDVLTTEGSRLKYEDGAFSKICSSLVLSYLKDPLTLMKEAYRLLRPGGVAVISSMKPGCDMTVLHHESITQEYSERRDRDGSALLSAAGKIKLKQDVGVYNFFTGEELERLAFDAGFTDISTCRSLGDQANVLRVVK